MGEWGTPQCIYGMGGKSTEARGNRTLHARGLVPYTRQGWYHPQRAGTKHKLHATWGDSSEHHTISDTASSPTYTAAPHRVTLPESR
jgi:hypothetical protein